MSHTQKTPPPEVTLVYRNLGMTHVFTAEEFRGFHVGGPTLRVALDNAIRALGKHITVLYGLNKQAEYDLEGTPEDFEDSLQDADAPLNFSVTAKMATESMKIHVN